MSHIPSLSNELFPWPRIHLGEVSLKATAIDQQTAFARLHRGSSQRSSHLLSSTRSRGRASSDVGPIPAKSRVRGRFSSFGSTQEYHQSGKISDRKVQDLLKLRKQKLKEAERKGNVAEFFRLKNLNLFDNIERFESKDGEPKEVELGSNSTGQSDHHNFTSEVDVFDCGFIPRPKSVTQGHTATLCWHLKIQYTQGLTVPEEFYLCNIHPTPSPCASSSSSFTLQPTLPSSLGSESRRCLRRTKVPSTGSSTSRNFSNPSSPAALSSIAIATEPSSSIKLSATAPVPDEEDSFLYIAKYINKHAKGNNRFKEAKRSGPQASSANVKHSFHSQCTCTNHDCRTYLSGPPSKHCRSCKLPRLQPEIAVAAERIAEMKTSVLVPAESSLPIGEPSEAKDFRKFQVMQEDLKLVEMYNAEMEKRCRNGVWWEGWLIVEELKRQGIVGSKPFVYDRDNSVA